MLSGNVEINHSIVIEYKVYNTLVLDDDGRSCYDVLATGQDNKGHPYTLVFSVWFDRTQGAAMLASAVLEEIGNRIGN